MSNCVPLIVLHGGAGPRRQESYDAEILHMRGLIEHARTRLYGGALALDVVVETISALEESGLYVAGRGASPNTAGEYELDAAIMEGSTKRAGAVAALQGFQHPIQVARSVLEASPYVLLAGRGAAEFAKVAQHIPILDPANWFTEVGSGECTVDDMLHGTVGCVVRDSSGTLVAGTSTGGLLGKQLGRVGDTPIIGAGTWADARVGISCTGVGEFFLRTAAAAQVAFRQRFGNAGLAQATAEVLTEITDLGGEGGIIAISSEGEIVMHFKAQRMLRAALFADGSICSEVW